MEIWIAGLAGLLLMLVWFWRRRAARDTSDAFVSSRRKARGSQAGHRTATDPETRFMEIRETGRQYKLLNESEQVLYQRLVEAMPNMLVFVQVGLAQLAQLRGRKAMEDLRDMNGRGVDFVVCRDDFAIIAAIELTWPKPAHAGVSQAEEVKAKALESLGVPLIVFRPNELPDADAISREIAAAIVRRNRLEADRESRLGHH